MMCVLLCDMSLNDQLRRRLQSVRLAGLAQRLAATDGVRGGFTSEAGWLNRLYRYRNGTKTPTITTYEQITNALDALDSDTAGTAGREIAR